METTKRFFGLSSNAKRRTQKKKGLFRNIGKPRKDTGGVRAKTSADLSRPLTLEEIQKLPSNPEIGDKLKDVPFLAKLSPEKRNKIGGAMVPRDYQDGEVVMQQGEPGTELFVITEGQARITFKDANDTVHDVAVLTKGDYCGETALVTKQARNATCTATGPLKTVVLTAHIFESLFTKEYMNIQFGHRDAVCAEAVSGAVDESMPWESGSGSGNRIREKNGETTELLITALKENILFQSFERVHLDKLVTRMWKCEVTDGTEVMCQGDDGDNLYVVESGLFGVFAESSETQSMEKLNTLGSGRLFGELALMYNSPRNATVVCEEDGVLWAIDRMSFRRILTQAATAKMAECEEFLRRVPLLKALLRSERSQLCEALEERSFMEGHDIVTQGEKGNRFFLIKSGEVTVTRRETPDAEVQQVGVLKSGDFFGERALLTDEERAATITVSKGPLRCFTLNRVAFDRTLGPLKDIMKRKVDAYEEKAHKKIDGSLAHMEYEDLNILGTIGIGAFGHVKLVQDQNSKRTYALKSVSKARIVKMGQQEHINNERDVLMRIDGHFFVNLHRTFSTKNEIHFLMDVALGGELFTLLRNHTRFAEPMAKFYAASVVCAFEYLQHRNIVYRDLKPENLLLDADGYIRLTDFGFAKEVRGRTNTLCGTPDYLAPEMVTGLPHGKAVDWWTLGILIYEMLACIPPFHAHEQMQVFKKIIRGKIKFPKYFSPSAIDIIKGLCTVNPAKRLGVTAGGAKAVKNHPWFRGFDWRALETHTMKAPFLPKIRDSTDITNFDDFDVPVITEYEDDGSGWDADF